MALVFVVDDDPDVRQLLTTFISMEGHKVVEAENADQAWEKLDQKPAVLFLDIDMPGETGVELVFRLRQNEEYKMVPVVFVTAYPERSAALQLTGEGAVSVIAKPFRKADIVEVLHSICPPGID